MKKIIATVLAMVMALALCTTAFAVTYGDLYEMKDGSFTKVDTTGKTISYTSASETKKDGSFEKGTIGYYTIGTDRFVEVPKDDADYRIDVDSVTKYLNKAEIADIEYTLKGESVSPANLEALEKCGAVYFDYTNMGWNDTTRKFAYKLFVTADGDYYTTAGVAAAAAANVKNILVDGQIVKVVAAVEGTHYNVLRHAWQIVDSKKAADGTVTGTAKCTRCGLVGTLTSKKGDVPTTANSEYFYEVTFGKTVYVYWTNGAAAGSTTTGAATSPKTFDAGIALYAAMALTSVAGSAVVIGKKKEF